MSPLSFTGLLSVLLLALTMASPSQAIWLEGIRWFRHEKFVRVVFDLSAPTEYRVSERLSEGYVDLILQGELNRKMAEEVAINESGILSAKQLRKTSTSLTWRIQVENISRIRTMSLEEQPYKVVVDFYHGSPSGGTVTAKATRRADTSMAIADGAKPEIAATAKKTSRKSTSQPVPAISPPEAKGARPNGIKTSAKGDPGSPDQRYEGLKADEKRRLLVGELLLQLSDTNGAIPYLEQVSATQPAHGWTRYLLAQTCMARGDQYRAQNLIEPLRGQESWKLLLQPLMARFTLPDDKGEVPGGDIPEEDLSFFIDILKRGASLTTADLYAKPKSSAGVFSTVTLLSGMGLGALLGLAAFAVAEARRRKSVDQMVRDRVMGMDMSPRASAAPREPSPDYLEVSRRVREELEEVMQSERRDAKPLTAFDERIRDDVPIGGDSLEERIYHLADEKKSIVEIAEILNLGVDEVRLHLELREQTGRIANA